MSHRHVRLPGNLGTPDCMGGWWLVRTNSVTDRGTAFHFKPSCPVVAASVVSDQYQETINSLPALPSRNESRSFRKSCRTAGPNVLAANLGRLCAQARRIRKKTANIARGESLWIALDSVRRRFIEKNKCQRV